MIKYYFVDDSSNDESSGKLKELNNVLIYKIILNKFFIFLHYIHFIVVYVGEDCSKKTCDKECPTWFGENYVFTGCDKEGVRCVCKKGNV